MDQITHKVIQGIKLLEKPWLALLNVGFFIIFPLREQYGLLDQANKMFVIALAVGALVLIFFMIFKRKQKWDPKKLPLIIRWILFFAFLAYIAMFVFASIANVVFISELILSPFDLNSFMPVLSAILLVLISIALNWLQNTIFTKPKN